VSSFQPRRIAASNSFLLLLSVFSFLCQSRKTIAFTLACRATKNRRAIDVTSVTRGVANSSAFSRFPRAKLYGVSFSTAFDEGAIGAALTSSPGRERKK